MTLTCTFNRGCREDGQPAEFLFDGSPICEGCLENKAAWTHEAYGLATNFDGSPLYGDEGES